MGDSYSSSLATYKAYIELKISEDSLFGILSRLFILLKHNLPSNHDELDQIPMLLSTNYLLHVPVSWQTSLIEEFAKFYSSTFQRWSLMKRTETGLIWRIYHLFDAV